MNERQWRKLDRALHALLSMGPVRHKETRFTKKDLEKKFRMRTDRTGKGRLEEL